MTKSRISLRTLQNDLEEDTLWSLLSLRTLQDDLEEDMLCLALHHAEGNPEEAAQMLGISRATYYRKLAYHRKRHVVPAGAPVDSTI